MTSNPEILNGKPVINGTRLSVEFIMNLLTSGTGYDEILDDYPHITIEDIYACLSYAATALKNDIYLDIEQTK